MKNYTLIGLASGIAIAFAIIFGGLPGFLWMILFGVIGFVVGAHFDGRIDIAAALNLNNRG